VSALVPYKRLDVAIDACRQLGATLKIVGRGPEEARLRTRSGDAVEFLGWKSDEEVRDLYQQSTAVLLPGIEDFGMVPVEAQACGTPVVALGSGGACETVRDGVTGILVADTSAAAFADGLDRVRSLERDTALFRAHAEQFSRTRFMTNFRNAVIDAVAECEARS
jgi:glycosyltransferase involved in cell wall biosynthesis